MNEPKRERVPRCNRDHKRRMSCSKGPLLVGESGLVPELCCVINIRSFDVPATHVGTNHGHGVIKEKYSWIRSATRAISKKCPSRAFLPLRNFVNEIVSWIAHFFSYPLPLPNLHSTVSGLSGLSWLSRAHQRNPANGEVLCS